ncbi:MULTISPECIES: phosphate/phosphite/phosphonate ABC transporter substrate-binding protein [Roseomonadaceae]|jgi:phosphonate transport system substrate-binding protein|uniref:Phosphate ABC transporter substrate-binding protein n=1 Tax=Roseicella frigidaeris TaxID=2230885 RepID=A0A327LXD5_9PROT|nr:MULTISPECIES: phosphate/phosphite/phosphonate ABC transporter substrate-binding protein [Acetobacteraceae]RAI55329.1 phosphate ABC transporter substrate-binding protein [Roseicella frigidaeris]CAH0129983.1 putative phosphite transport system-binding protein PtxB [Roseomonas sp. CECT 9278]
MNRRSLLAAPLLLPALAATQAHAQAQNPTRLRMALLPDENASTIIQNAQPLRTHLMQALGRDVQVVVTTDYSSMIEAMRFGRIEIAYFGPFSYVLAKSRAEGIEPFAVGVERGSPTYRSIIIATADGPVKKLEDVRGHPMAFGDQASTSSHLVPRATILRRTGLVGERDFRVVHVGTHDAVARTVQSGRAPVGALSELIFHSLLARNVIQRERLVDVAFSDPIPNYPMVMQGNLAPELKQAIRNAFLNLRDGELLRNFRVEGFAATDDAAYDVLRETARILNLDLGRMS